MQIGKRKKNEAKSRNAAAAIAFANGSGFAIFFSSSDGLFWTPRSETYVHV